MQQSEPVAVEVGAVKLLLTAAKVPAVGDTLERLSLLGLGSADMTSQILHNPFSFVDCNNISAADRVNVGWCSRTQFWEDVGSSFCAL